MPDLLELGFDPTPYLARNEPKKELLQALRQWIKTQDDIPRTLTDSQLVLFCLACLCNEEATRRCIREYYNARKNGPELFNNRETSRADISQQLNALVYVNPPIDTDDGYRIIIHRLIDTTPSTYHMEVAMKILFMLIDAALHRGPPKGLIILFDMQGIRFTHLTRVRIGAVRKFFNYLQEGLPVRLHAIHVLNIVSFFDKIMSITRPFMRKEILNMLHLHPVDTNMEEFYEKHIPRKCLPSNFGGDLPSLEELQVEQCRFFQELGPYFKAEEKQRGVQSTEIESNDSSLGGLGDNFKKIEID